MTENWKPVVGYEGLYEVSDLGRVRSLYKNSIRAPGRRKDGYLQMPLYRDGRARSPLVQYLVLEAFVGPRPSPQHQACHNNGLKADNRLTNLRWDTPKSNNADKHRHGTHRFGETAPTVKLTEDAVRQIRARRGERQQALADEFGCTFSNISAVQCGKSWRHV